MSLDSASTEPARKHEPINYPPFEPPLSTDLLTSVTLTGTNHAEDQPVHLRVVSTLKYVEEVDKKKGGNVAIGAGVASVASTAAEEDTGEEKLEGFKEEQATRESHIKINVGEYAGLLGRACPAGVYEYVPVEGTSNSDGTWNGYKFVINSQVSLPLRQFISFHRCSFVRIAFTASCAISRFLVKISPGQCQREVAALSTVSSHSTFPALCTHDSVV